VRFLLVNNHCISDPTVGVTQSLRTIMSWLADAGHDCHILTTARFESADLFTIEAHLAGLGVDVPSTPSVEYEVGGVPVTLLLTRHHDEAAPDPDETRRYLELFEERLQAFAPDQLIATNAHPMVQAAIARAHDLGITTVFAVRSFGYYDRRYFDHVDHAFTCGDYLTAFYREKIGLVTTPLEPPIDWSSVVAAEDERRFVTFVHPALHKGLLVFARLAMMLGARRPDIPVLVVQSGRSAGQLNAIPGVDFSRYPQILAAPAVPSPADYLALTRVLLVPSVWDEPFGRVAAEAMINGIPPLVSTRGALPHVVGGDVSRGGGGYVLPLPDWLTVEERRVPDERDIEPWFQAVCALWDDPALYDRVSARARAIACDRYGEEVSRRRHVDYFTALRHGWHTLGDRMASRAP
jgi:glycosyltransferase involved in cell wall biosynthesis